MEAAPSSNLLDWKAVAQLGPDASSADRSAGAAVALAHVPLSKHSAACGHRIQLEWLLDESLESAFQTAGAVLAAIGNLEAERYGRRWAFA